VDLFTVGLGQPLASDVEMQRPANLQTAMSLARAFEKRSAEAARATSSSSPRQLLRPRPAAPTASAAASAGSPAKKPDDQRPRFRRLSPHEIAEKRLSGQCYFCPEKFTKDHKCARKGVFLLELEDGEGSSKGDDTVSISLHALTGITVAHTMKLHVQGAGMALVTLLDSGSTHNFINADVASKLGLHITPRPGLSINVANGERMASSGLCAATDMDVHDEQFSLDCYALPLDGFDIVLGVHWLRTLGPIIWNFDAISMLFWRDGRTVSWTVIGGRSPPVLALASGHDVLQTLLDAYSDIFTEPHGLPPQRQQDHRIHLLPTTAPVAVRPY